VVQDLIIHVSLNSTNVLIQGAMTVDVATVPATITDLSFDEGDHSSSTWATDKDHAATATGSFLTGGQPNFTGIDIPTAEGAKIADYLDATKISVVSDGSTDSTLHFKIQWTKQIPSGSKLHFQVTKYDPKDTKKTSPVKSMDYLYAVTYSDPAAAAGNGAKPTAAEDKSAAGGAPDKPAVPVKKKTP
jgi:hypothetical protein